MSEYTEAADGREEEELAPTAPAHEPEGDASEPETGNADVNGEESDGEEIAGDPLTEAVASIARLEDELARARADYYNLNQEYSNYVKRSKADAVARYDEGKAKVIGALLPVLDDANLAREHGELEGAPGRIIDKLEQSLATAFTLERFGQIGDAFDPQIHEALMHSTSADVESEQVQAVIQAGYRLGEKVLRPARVAVVSPE